MLRKGKGRCGEGERGVREWRARWPRLRLHHFPAPATIHLNCPGKCVLFELAENERDEALSPPFPCRAHIARCCSKCEGTMGRDMDECDHIR